MLKREPKDEEASLPMLSPPTHVSVLPASVAAERQLGDNEQFKKKIKLQKQFQDGTSEYNMPIPSSFQNDHHNVPSGSVPSSSLVRSASQSFVEADAVRAAADGDVRRLAQLLYSGVNLAEVADFDHRTPMHLACSQPYPEPVRFLVEEAKCHIFVRDRFGATPVDYAVKNENPEILNILRKTFLPKLQCQLWNCENDPSHLLLFNDLSRVYVSALSSSVAPNLRKSYESAFRIFSSILKEKGVVTTSIQEVVLMHARDEGFMTFLEDQIQCVSETDSDITTVEISKFKQDLISSMTVDQKVFVATNQCVYKLTRQFDQTVSANSFEVFPLLDILRCRIQICTPKGFVLSGLEHLKFKTNLLKYVFTQLGIPLLKIVPAPLKFSGADYIPAGKELCFFGSGRETYEASIRYMMQKDVFGHNVIAVVRDVFDRNIKFPCLDSVMKIIAAGVIAISESVLGEQNPNRRMVDEYVYVGEKQYQLRRAGVELERYLRSLDFAIIPIPTEVMEEDGLCIINLGRGDLYCSNRQMADALKKSDHFSGTVYLLEEKLSYDIIAGSSLMFRSPSAHSSHPIPTKISHEHWAPYNGKERRHTTDQVLMVAPVGFKTNEETLVDNHFMHRVGQNAKDIEACALKEFSQLHMKLVSAGVRCITYSSEVFHGTPDAVFPNNWFSTHPKSELGESTVVFYPLKTVSRRSERRELIVSDLQHKYSREISFVQWEQSDFGFGYLESTGVLILDRVNLIAYAALSRRCYKKIAHTWAHRLGYNLCLFKAKDAQGRPIYHTNVMMSVGTTMAVVTVEAIEDAVDRERVLSSLARSGHEVIPITRDQMNEFCANILELRNKEGKKILVMSTRAYNAFTSGQKKQFMMHVDQIIHSPIPTIEMVGGGGVRCMLGEIF